MLKPLVKWLMAGAVGLAVTVLILVIFTVFAGPTKDWLTDYFFDIFYQGPDELPVVSFPENYGGELPEWEWAKQHEELPHCDFSISGRVTQNDGAPIEDAEVKIYNTGVFDSGEYRYTDDNGEFSYSEIGTETCNKEHFYVSISKNGFEPHYVVADPDDEINISLSFYGTY